LQKLNEDKIETIVGPILFISEKAKKVLQLWVLHKLQRYF